LQQEPQHAGGQHLGLAGAGRGGKPHRAMRRHGAGLVALQGIDLAHSALPPRPCHSSSRINWS
jgi:hypothetical protein